MWYRTVPTTESKYLIMRPWVSLLIQLQSPFVPIENPPSTRNIQPCIMGLRGRRLYKLLLSLFKSVSLRGRRVRRDDRTWNQRYRVNSGGPRRHVTRKQVNQGWRGVKIESRRSTRTDESWKPYPNRRWTFVWLVGRTYGGRVRSPKESVQYQSSLKGNTERKNCGSGTGHLM